MFEHASYTTAERLNPSELFLDCGGKKNRTGVPSGRLCCIRFWAVTLNFTARRKSLLSRRLLRLSGSPAYGGRSFSCVCGLNLVGAVLVDYFKRVIWNALRGHHARFNIGGVFYFFLLIFITCAIVSKVGNYVKNKKYAFYFKRRRRI